MSNLRRQCRVLCIVVLVGGAVVASARQSTAADEDSAETTHREVDPIDPKDGPHDILNTIGMDRNDRMIASMTRRESRGRDAGQRHELVFYGADGARAAAWDLGETVGLMVHGAREGDFYIGGYGEVIRLDGEGNRQARADLVALAGKNARAAGIATSGDHVFVAVAFGGTLASKEDIYRFKRDLTKPVRIVTDLRGCCNHIDLEVKGDRLIIAENTRFRVNTYDFDGNELLRWGKRDRTSIEGFASCCNPVGLALAPGDVLITAESGVGRIKRYSPTGEYLGLVGYVGVVRWTGARADSCYIPIEVTADGRRMYVMDIRANLVRVMQAKGGAEP